MGATGSHTGRTAYTSEYRSLEELKVLLDQVYGPSVSLIGGEGGDFSFRASIFRDDLLSLCHCQTGDQLNSTFNADCDDIIVLFKPRGDFAIHTWCGDYPLSHDLGYVFTMNHAIGYSSTRSTATTALQISRTGFEAALRQYVDDTPPQWSGIQDFSLAGGFGHLVQALASRYRESFAAGLPGDASLGLVRSAAMVAISELVARGHDDHRRDRLAASRRNVLRAVDLINSQTAPLTIHDLSAALGISVRALQDGFRKHLNLSPHTLLKTGRIEGARRDLVAGRVGSIREAAAKWGFSNLGRFSQEYHGVTGESPRDTLGIRPRRIDRAGCRLD